jgi:nicotinic acid phosphoribosyltransferase
MVKSGVVFVKIKVLKQPVKRFFAAGVSVKLTVHGIPGNIQQVPESCVVAVVPEKTFSVTIEGPKGSFLWYRNPILPVVEDHLRELERVWCGSGVHGAVRIGT